ncbi:MAG TPA: FxsA family protein [Alphaproteobacteria bacterium]|nr:FxsA family protein [Alphaproteobacteria bacterium]
MAPMIVLALLALPFVEIAVFIKVGSLIGAGPVIALTLASMLAGSALMRHQGLATLARARITIARNEPPLDELLDGLCILLAGALLIIPGFVTDALGLLLFVPAIRRGVRKRLWRLLKLREQRIHGTVIETEYTIVKENGADKPDSARPRLGNDKRNGP